jgi:hypothetical protein
LSASPAGWEGANCDTKAPCPSDFCSNGGAVDTSNFIVDGTCCDCSAVSTVGNTCSQIASDECTLATEDRICSAITDDNIQTAVNIWISDQEAAVAEYGHISDW